MRMWLKRQGGWVPPDLRPPEARLHPAKWLKAYRASSHNPHITVRAITPVTTGSLGLVSMLEVSRVPPRRRIEETPLCLLGGANRAYCAHDTFSTTVARRARGRRVARHRHRSGAGNRWAPRVACGDHRRLVTRRRWRRERHGRPERAGAGRYRRRLVGRLGPGHGYR